MEAETQERTDVKGKAKLESSPESYGLYSPKKNTSAKSVFTRLGNTIDQVQPRLRSTVERLPRKRSQNEELIRNLPKVDTIQRKCMILICRLLFLEMINIV